MDMDRLEELAQSIRMKGVIQPILVRPGNDGPDSYELIAGERRLKASRIAGYDRIPAMIKPIKDKDLLEIALLENIQRENLNALDEAKAYRALLEEHGYTQEDLAKRIGKNRSTIANLIRLLQLPESLQLDLAENRISTGHARTLLAVADEAEQLKLRDKIVEERISVSAPVYGACESLGSIQRPAVYRFLRDGCRIKSHRQVFRNRRFAKQP